MIHNKKVWFGTVAAVVAGAALLLAPSPAQAGVSISIGGGPYYGGYRNYGMYGGYGYYNPGGFYRGYYPSSVVGSPFIGGYSVRYRSYPVWGGYYGGYGYRGGWGGYRGGHHHHHHHHGHHHHHR